MSRATSIFPPSLAPTLVRLWPPSIVEDRLRTAPRLIFDCLDLCLKLALAVLTSHLTASPALFPAPISSYTTDPKFQRYFTYFWLALLGIIVLLLNPFPALVRSRRLLSGWTIWEDLDSAAYRPLPSSAESPTPPIVEHTPASPPAQDHASSVAGWRRLSAPVFEAWATVMSFTPPVPTLPHWLGGAGGQDYVRKSYLSLKVGQVLLAVLYAAGVWVCVCKDAQLRSNPNRFGECCPPLARHLSSHHVRPIADACIGTLLDLAACH